MGRATLPAGLSRRVGQFVGPHPIGTHCWAAKGGPVHGKTHLSGPLGKEVGQSPRTALQAQQVKTPLSNWPTRRAGWNQLPRTPLPNWPTRRAGWNRLTEFLSLSQRIQAPVRGGHDAFAGPVLPAMLNIGQMLMHLTTPPVTAFTHPRPVQT